MDGIVHDSLDDFETLFQKSLLRCMSQAIPFTFRECLSHGENDAAVIVFDVAGTNLSCHAFHAILSSER